MQSTPKKEPLLYEQIACGSLEGILMRSENRNLAVVTCDCDHSGTLEFADVITFSDMTVKMVAPVPGNLLFWIMASTFIDL